MNRALPKDAPGDRPIADRSSEDGAKFRQCLKCRAEFPSEWAGQRVCARCKKKSQWRSGALPRSY